LELPSEQGAPEVLALGGVVRRDLDVRDLTWHRCLLGCRFAALPSVRNPARSVQLMPAAAPTPGRPAIFAHMIGYLQRGHAAFPVGRIRAAL
jgi:hypothetical protein